MKLLSFLFAAMLLSSCVSIKEPLRNDLKPLCKSNLSVLNGNYENIPVKDTYRALRFDTWNGLVIFRKDTAQYNGSYVRLEAKDEKRIHVTVLNGDQIIKEYTIKGKVENNYFVAKRRIKMFGFPMIFFVSSDTKYRFGVTQAGNLAVDTGYSQFGMCLFIAAGNTTYFNLEYKRK